MLDVKSRARPRDEARRHRTVAAVIDDECRILVTGAAGFIGFHVARRLLAQGRGVVGLDSMTPITIPR